jgi:hypothetical protein
VVLEPFCGRRRPGRPVSSSLAVLQDGGLVALWGRGPTEGSSMEAHFFFQWIMTWRSFPWAGDSGCQSFRSPWCFTSAKCVSCLSARSLTHGAHVVCVCVPGSCGTFCLGWLQTLLLLMFVS